MRRLILAAGLGMLVIAGLLMVVLQYFEPSLRQAIDRTQILPDGGHAFYVQPVELPRFPFLFEVTTDNVTNASNLVLLENDKPLTGQHARHNEIRDSGAGRYSHWGDPGGNFVIFSSSDNTDPRTNGRSYEIVARPSLSNLGTALVLGLLAFILMLQQTLFPAARLIYGLGAVGFAVFASFFFGRVTFGIDTVTYWTWSAWVPLGYPLFLSSVMDLFGSLRWAGTIQITTLVMACVFIAAAVERVTSSRWAGIAALLLLFCDTPIFFMQGTLLSEALFVPALLANIGSAIFLINGKRVIYALTLAATAALAMFVRPAGYYIPLGIVFLLMVQPSRLRWNLRWVLAPFALLMLATLLINVGVRGSAVASQTGKLLFAHVAFMFEPQFSSDTDRNYANAVSAALESRQREYSTLHDRASRIAFSMNDYNGRMDAADQAIDARCILETNKPCNFSEREAVLRRFFLSTIYHKPAEYLRLISDGLSEAWRATIMDHWNSFSSAYALEAANHSARIDQIRRDNLPLSSDDISLSPDLIKDAPGMFTNRLDQVREFLRAQRWLIDLIGVITFLAMGIAPFWRSPHWIALGYCGVMIHGSMLLTSAVTVFIPRYTLPVDPILLLAGVVALHGATEWLAVRSKSRYLKYRRSHQTYRLSSRQPS